MSKLRAVLVLVGLLAASSAAAQTLPADRISLKAGPCVLTSVAGSPNQFVLSGGCSSITTDAATNLTLAPTGDLITNPAGKDILPNLNYDINIGALAKKYLTFYAAELWVETLVAQNTIATIGGRVLVAPTNTLTADLAPATTTITVKYNNFTSGDRVYMEANGAVEFMAVTSSSSGSGPYTYTVTRDLDGSGANQWYAGDALLDTGTTGNGFIDLYSTAGILSTGTGPTIVGNVRTGTTYNAYGPRWAIGNLNGLYGYASSIYGAAFGDPSAINVDIDATNGFRIRNGTTNKFVADTSGNLSIVGDLSVGTLGVMRSGATAYLTGTGWWMEFNAGTPRFRIGNPAGNRLTWDGSTLTIVGDGSGVTSINGGNIQTNTITASQIASGTITATQIQSGTITSTQIASATITAGNISSGTITATQIAAGTITASNISSHTLTATQIQGGTITANEIAGGTIVASNIQAGTITFDRLVGTDITALGSVTAGSFNIGSGAFSVTSGGVLTTSGSTHNGNVHVANGGSLYIEGALFFPNNTGANNRTLCMDSGGTVYTTTFTC